MKSETDTTPAPKTWETPAAWRLENRHWKDRVIAWGARNIIRRNLAMPLPWNVHRIGFRFAGWLRFNAKEAQVDKLPNGSGLIIRHPNPVRRIIWIHGGGFTIGSPETHRAMLSHLAMKAQAQIYVPKYALAPENPFPAAVNDVLQFVDSHWSSEDQIGPISLGGDSAGGCLALVALEHLLGKDITPHRVILASPATWLDPDRDVPPAQDLLFPLSLLRRIGRDYTGDADPSNPQLSPRFASFANAPKTLIHCAIGEYLEQDTDLIAEQLRRYDTNVTLEKAPKAPHVWHYMAGKSPLADDAIARMASFLVANA